MVTVTGQKLKGRLESFFYFNSIFSFTHFFFTEEKKKGSKCEIWSLNQEYTLRKENSFLHEKVQKQRGKIYCWYCLEKNVSQQQKEKKIGRKTENDFFFFNSAKKKN